MLYFQNDYHAGCHAEILRRLDRLSQRDFPGYGQDELCGKAADTIRRLCGREDLAVHFLVGGTQTNLTVIAAALRPYQAVIAAQSGAISMSTKPALWRLRGTRCWPCPPGTARLRRLRWSS